MSPPLWYGLWLQKGAIFMAKRRANGEGNIRKRKDGRWEGRYTAGRDPDTGKPIYKNVLGKTQAETKEKLKQAIEENKGLDVVKAGRYTVGQWMDVWFENYAKIKVRPSSHQTYQGYIKNHIKPAIGDIPLNKLTSLELQALYKKLLEGGRVERVESKNKPKGLSPKTVRNIHQIISSALELARSQKLISTNPADSCALPKVEHREMKTLTAEQLAAFFREARNSGVFEMYYLVPMFITTLSQTRMKSRFLAADEYISPKKSNSVGASWLKPSRKIAHLRLSSPPYIMEAQRRQAR